MIEAQEVKAISGVSNDAANAIAIAAPYIVDVQITGAAPILFHRWSNEAVAEKAAAKKGSKAKKTDDIETYLYRCEDGTIGIPGRYLVGSLTDKKNGAAKYLQDPRSPRKSALDLFKGGIVPLTILASTGKATWDYIDQQRVVIQNAGITRCRPALSIGWSAAFLLQVLIPEYITPQLLHEALINAGRLVGIADFRPTYGRFNVTKFTKVTEAN